MKPYHLLLLGHHPNKPEWSSAVGVFGMVTFGITDAFRRLPHVELAISHIKEPLPATPADFVLVNCFCPEDPPLEELRKATGARKIVSFREIPGPYDHSFTFVPATGWPHTLIPLPCCKALMHNVPKEPGSILVDHTWYVEDHTAEIEGWLEDYTDGPVYRLIRGGTENHPVPTWMKSIDYAPYPDYLKATEQIERHIMTHIEGYPFGVIDFAARGTQVLTPPNLMPSSMIGELGIPVFQSREELRALLARPGGDEWNRKIDLCTDYLDCAKIIDEWFQGQLL
jgi:hypothetical protein